MNPSLAPIALLCLAASLSAASIQREDAEESARIFPEDARIRQLADDLRFTEGPVWMGGADGFLVFSDIPADRLLRWDEEGGVRVFRAPSSQTNGNTLDLQGRLVSAEHWGRRLSLTLRDGTVLPLLEEHQGGKFNSPNDVVVRSDGTIWFTDPDYGLRGRPREQEGHHVYRFDPLSGRVAAVATDFDKPNGLCFSPDERLLYIADSGRPKHIRVFEASSDGALSGGRVFAKLDVGGPDGIRCDTEGRIWSSSGDGVQVFAPDGSRIARVLLPKGGANLAFGGPEGRTLFVTARNYLFSVPTLAACAARRN